ncbi:6-phosphogluconolactonase [Phenylobacterium sp. LjRoot219]|uniref:6-phosphogluconolactonase n=1 Tax=Phenylobacterium sp. LjRoot219 TaxID=3342283 RepID=UPI003ECC3CC2
MIETFSPTAAAADAAAFGIGRQLAEALKTHGRAGLVATGGRSPGPVFDRLRQQPGIDWSRVVVTLSDERCVGPDDAASNARAVRERLLVGEAAKAHFLPLWPPPDPAALRAIMPFDAVMLGMGEDGHIASLIPGDPGLAAAMDPASAQLTVSVPEGLGSPPLARISLTFAALLQARAIFLLIAGDTKREVVARAEAGADLPVRALITQSRAHVRVLWSPAHEGN